MPLYLLDTDHVSLLLGGHEALVRRLAAHPPESLRVSLVTAQELLGGWLPQLKRPQSADRLVWAYEGFRRALAFLCDVHLLGFGGPPRRSSGCAVSIVVWAPMTCASRPWR